MDELRIPQRFNMDAKKKLQSSVLDMKSKCLLVYYRRKLAISPFFKSKCEN